MNKLSNTLVKNWTEKQLEEFLEKILKKLSNDVVKSATIEDLKQNPHVQGLLESYKRLIFHLPPIFVKEVEREFDLARAKLKEWE